MDSQSWLKYGDMDTELAEIAPTLPPFSIGDAEDVPSLRQAMGELIGQLIEAGVIPTPDMTGISKEDIQIPTRDGQSIRAIKYKPESASANGPLALLYFGGGWCIGFPESMEKQALHLTKTHGAVVLAVDYRKAPEKVFPTAANDAWDSVKWAAENASKLGADPSKGFLVGGVSAGATLSQIVAHQARDEGLSPPITGIWACVPFLVHHTVVPEKYKEHYRSYEQNANAPVLDKKALDFFLKWYKPDPASPFCSPLLWPSGHKNLPPTYFQVCGMDPLRDEALIYEYHLREECGVKTKVDIYPGIPHGMFDVVPQLAQSKKAGKDQEAGFKWLLENK